MNKRWYFTWGCGQEFPHCYTMIEGEFEEAREIMVDRYGCSWSMQYSESEFAGQVEKYGLREIVWGSNRA